jgi:hypothetical protein
MLEPTRRDAARWPALTIKVGLANTRATGNFQAFTISPNQANDAPVRQPKLDRLTFEALIASIDFLGMRSDRWRPIFERTSLELHRPHSTCLAATSLRERCQMLLVVISSDPVSADNHQPQEEEATIERQKE